jgi:hypothetical protein
MRRLADAKPDPKTGQMTAISGTVEVKFRQAYLNHPPEQVANAAGAVSPATAASRE